jgi:hypothetical protein
MKALPHMNLFIKKDVIFFIVIFLKNKLDECSSTCQALNLFSRNHQFEFYKPQVTRDLHGR